MGLPFHVIYCEQVTNPEPCEFEIVRDGKVCKCGEYGKNKIVNSGGAKRLYVCDKHLKHIGAQGNKIKEYKR